MAKQNTIQANRHMLLASVFCILTSVFCILTSGFAQQFPCDGKLYFFRHINNGQNYLSYIDGYTTATPVVANVCPLASTLSQNALGANPKDNYLYYLNCTTNDLNRIDANCNTTVVCPSLACSAFGCFDHLGRYWTVNATNDSLIAYDISTCSIVKGPFKIAPASWDIVFNMADCHFYTIDSTQAIKLDTNGNVVATYTPGFNAGNYGGIASGSDGNIYGIDHNLSDTTQPGDLYQFNLSTNSPGGLIYSFPNGVAYPCGCDMASFPCPNLQSLFSASPLNGCAPLTVQFTDSSTGLVNTFLWNFGDGTVDSLNLNPSHTYTTAGTYTATLIVHALSTCLYIAPDTFSVTINVFALPSATISGATIICMGSSTILTALGGGNYLWNTGATTPSITATAAGAYSVTVTNTNGCTQTGTVSIIQTTPVALTASASVTSAVCSGNTGIATVNSTGGTLPYTYNWSPSGGITATATGLATGTYTVTVTDANGCTQTQTVTVTSSGTIYIPTIFAPPNAFTPNMDKDNEQLCVYGNCIEKMELTIYNRWGEKVFETTDIKQCWDGTYKGKPLNTAVFVYYMKATLTTGEKIEKKGNVSLIR